MLVAGMLVRHTGNGLRELLPSGAARERTFVSVAVDRYHDDAGPHLRQGFRREAAPRESTRTVTLREYVGIADQRAQLLQVFLAIEFEIAGTFTRIGIDYERLN